MTDANGARPLHYAAPARAGRIDLLLRRDGPRVLLFDGGLEVASRDLGLTSSILIEGPNGPDTALTVDYTSGSIPLPIGYRPGALGPHTDNALTIRGGEASVERHAVTAPHAGVIELDGVPITYSNLTPIDDTVPAANFTFTAPAGATTINVTTGPVVAGFQTGQINDGGTAKFELLNFANKTNVTVNADPSTPTGLTLNLPTSATGLATLGVGGGAAGSVFNVQAVPGGLTLGVNPTASAIVNVSLAGNAQAISSPVSISNSGGTTAVAVDDSSDPTGRTVTISGGQITGLAPATISFDLHTVLILVEGGTGSDTFRVVPGAAAVGIDGGNPTPPSLPGDTLTVDTSATTAPALSITSTPAGYAGQFNSGNAARVTFAYIETISPALDTAHLSMTTSVGAPVTQPFVLAGTGTAPFALTVDTGAVAPGIALDPATGALTGVPTTAGEFTAAITVRDSTAAAVSGTVALLVNPALAIAPASLPPATVLQPYSQTLTVTGGTLPYTAFAVTAFDGGTTGFAAAAVTADAGAGTFTVSGTPSAAGTATFTVHVVDAAGATLTATYALDTAPPIPALSTLGLAALVTLLLLAGAAAIRRA